MSTRNQEIITMLDNGQVPLLPFEVDALEDRLGDHARRQHELGRLKAQAMSESSETWHDNSFADTVRDTVAGNTRQAQTVQSALSTGRVIEYPDPTEPTATLGSIVSVLYPGEREGEPTFITGITRDIPAGIAENLPPGAVAATLSSPLGRAILNAVVGGEVVYTAAQDRQLSVSVLDITQLSLSLPPSSVAG